MAGSLWTRRYNEKVLLSMFHKNGLSMNLRQLIYLREIARNGLNVSKAAKRLHTSQPGISQQILALERELGVSIFIREKGRLTGITPRGRQVVQRAESALLDIDDIRNLRNAADADRGTFVIATTHTQARYVIPETLARFAQKYPNVQVTLQHGNSALIRQALESGTADIGITPDEGPYPDYITALECRRYRRIVLAPDGHPLVKRKRCSLRDLAQFPFVTLEPAVSARRSVLDAFEKAGLDVNVILSAIDADVVKACVERGLGLTALVEVAYDPKRDTGISLVRTPEFFAPSVTSVAIHRKRHLPAYAYDFIEMFAPQWTRRRMDHAMAGRPGARTSSGRAPTHPRTTRG